MLIKEEKKIVVKEEKGVIKHGEKVFIKEEVIVIEDEVEVIKQEKDKIKEEVKLIKQEKGEIKEEVEVIKLEKDEIKQEIKLEKGKDSFEFAEISTREPDNKNRKRSCAANTANTANTAKKPKSYWTPEEDQALFDAVTSFVNGSWKEVCSRHPSLEERGTRMVHQRWNTKSKYFSGNSGK